VFPSYNLEEDVRDFFKNKLHCDDKIQRIERLMSGIIFVYFENEEIAVDVFKKLEKYKFENVFILHKQLRTFNYMRVSEQRISNES
jgi:hypothetical protein